LLKHKPVTKLLSKLSRTAKVKLSQALTTTKAAYTATRDNLASKSKELDDAMIRE
jgi:hypothetical protein